MRKVVKAFKPAASAAAASVAAASEAEAAQSRQLLQHDQIGVNGCPFVDDSLTDLLQHSTSFLSLHLRLALVP